MLRNRPSWYASMQWLPPTRAGIFAGLFVEPSAAVTLKVYDLVQHFPGASFRIRIDFQSGESIDLGVYFAITFFIARCLKLGLLVKFVAITFHYKLDRRAEIA